MIYYDFFAEKYVTEKDDNAPPERYLAYMKGTKGIYIERFSVCVNGNSSFGFDFAYSELEMTNYPERVAKNRLFHFEKNNISKESTRLVAYLIPPSVYDKIVKQWELKVKCGELICDYTKTDWNDCCECSTKDHCDKYNERSEIIGDLLGEVIGAIKNEGR